MKIQIKDNKNVGLIIVDTITMLYRLEKSDEEPSKVNRELGKQMGYLTQITRKKNIPVLLTNQVYSLFDERTKIEMVGGDVMKYGSKCLIELQVAVGNKRRIILRKHRHIPQKDAVFEIVGEGTKSARSKGFKLF